AAARPKDQEGGMGYDVQLADALKGALPFVKNSFKDQPLIEARLRMTLGISFAYLGKASLAADQFQAARTLYTKHLGPDHSATLVSVNNLANSYDALGRHAEADRAMAWLQQAIAAGYMDAAHMKKDKDLDALRDREDFKKLLTELE